MSKQTTFPWKFCYDGQITGSDGMAICFMPQDTYKDFVDNPRDMFHARLIARCPELHELATYLSIERNPNIYIAMDMAMKIIEIIYPTREDRIAHREAYEAKAEGKL